jgi:hypothetical protein
VNIRRTIINKNICVNIIYIWNVYNYIHNTFSYYIFIIYYYYSIETGHLQLLEIPLWTERGVFFNLVLAKGAWNFGLWLSQRSCLGPVPHAHFSDCALQSCAFLYCFVLLWNVFCDHIGWSVQSVTPPTCEQTVKTMMCAYAYNVHKNNNNNNNNVVETCIPASFIECQDSLLCMLHGRLPRAQPGFVLFTGESIDWNNCMLAGRCDPVCSDVIRFVRPYNFRQTRRPLELSTCTKCCNYYQLMLLHIRT